MKKSVLVLAVLLLTSMASYGQFVLGIKAGANTSLGFNQDWSWSSNNLNLKSDIGAGFHAGIFARFGKGFYVQPEVYYNYQKNDFNFDFSDGIQIPQIVTTRSIDVPLLIGARLINTKLFNLRLMAGPKFRFNAGSSVKNFDDLLSDVRGAQVGLDTGIGMDIFFMTLDVRYNLIQPIYKFTTSAGDNVNVQPTNAFTVSLGFKLIDIK